MKLRFMRYDRIQDKHPGCLYDIEDQKIDETFPYYDQVPVASWPVVRVWPNQAALDSGDETLCVALYWLREEAY